MMSKRGFRILALCFVLLIAAYGGYVALDHRYHINLARLNDVFVGLVAYMETHEGRFPPSEKALVDASFTRQHDGTLVVKPVEGLHYVSKTYGVALEGLKDFEIPYGIELAELHSDGSGILRKKDRSEVLLLKSPFGLKDSRLFSLTTYRVGCELQKAKP